MVAGDGRVRSPTHDFKADQWLRRVGIVVTWTTNADAEGGKLNTAS